MVVKHNWVGRPVNVFKSSKKTMPAQLFKDSDRDGVADVFDCKPHDPNREGLLQAVVGAVSGAFRKGRGSIAQGWREGMSRPSLLTKKVLVRKRQGMAVRPVSYADYAKLRRQQLVAGSTPHYIKKRIMVQKKLVQAVMPYTIPGQSLAGAETIGKNKTKGYVKPGRPFGSFKDKYAPYGGVYGYRKAMAEKRRMQREAMRQVIEQRKVAQAPYEYQDYQASSNTDQSGTSDQAVVGHQVPQQPKYQQVEYPQPPQKPPVKTVFRSSGGSPYPPVNEQPLTSSRQTVPYGYVETVDSFTGRRFLKKLPPTERWSGGEQ